ncbi:hypothetical protein [Brevundimonas lenta]|uniref:Uncharacterized protein n=1 Tax=Brevundimonas lenta TaxID=424796 RepID=A0A7W6JGG4_9CAUL|nr:hypothetical protein [Brevundimonas lenta]MBB4083656.1 hypothetical protein [Brevundimonas lenta]
MADGAYRWQGNAPAPDAARVDEIDAAFDDAQAGAFAEPVRAAAVEKIERALATARTGDLTEAAAQLTHVRALLADLSPASLEPRRGLGGLFDSRNGRLKRFRDAYARAAASLADVAADLTGRVEGAARRSETLDSLWGDIRDAVVDLDTHLAAAARRLTGSSPLEEDAAFALDGRKATLDACRGAAIGALPLIRGAQNADARAAETLKACADGVALWRDDWKDALGLSGKRPKKVRPDHARLLKFRDDLVKRVDRALVEVTASRARRADVEGRLAELRRPL